MSRISSAVPDDHRMANALFREVPEDEDDEEEDEDKKEEDEEEDEEDEGYSE